MKPNGFVVLQSDYVIRMADFGIQDIKDFRQREKEKAIEQVAKRSFLGIKLKDRTREECIKVLSHGYLFDDWSLLGTLCYARMDQLVEIKKAAKLVNEIVVETDLAAYLLRIQEQHEENE